MTTMAPPPLHRNSSSRERADRPFDRREERSRLQVTKRSFSREKEEQSRERERRGSGDPARRVANVSDDRDRRRRERSSSKDNGEFLQQTSPRPGRWGTVRVSDGLEGL